MQVICLREVPLAGLRAVDLSPYTPSQAAIGLGFRWWDTEAGTNTEGLRNSWWGTYILSFVGLTL